MLASRGANGIGRSFAEMPSRSARGVGKCVAEMPRQSVDGGKIAREAPKVDTREVTMRVPEVETKDN